MPPAHSRNVALYFACQALVASTMSLLIVESALVGSALAPHARLATLPVSLQQLVTLLCTYPASHLMARMGRRAGFSIGAVLGALGGAVATLGILRGSFALFCAGTALAGGYSAFATYYRFAAAESVDPARRDRAISWVMSAGVLAAVAGPWLARQTKDILPTAFAGSYLILVGMALTALAILQFVRPPPAQAGPTGARLSVGHVLRKRSFLTFAAVGMVAGGVMTFVMTATPLAMATCHHGFDHTSVVIQWHVLAMFLPSFFTARLIARVGAPQVVLAGLGLCALSIAVNATGTSVMHFQLGLALLGVGWNFAYIGATTLLTRAAPEDRPTIQGLNDLLVFSAVAVASLLAGVAEDAIGWRALNLSVLPLLVLVGLAVAVRMRAKETGAAAST